MYLVSVYPTDRSLTAKNIFLSCCKTMFLLATLLLYVYLFYHKKQQQILSEKRSKFDLICHYVKLIVQLRLPMFWLSGDFFKFAKLTSLFQCFCLILGLGARLTVTGHLLQDQLPLELLDKLGI